MTPDQPSFAQQHFQAGRGFRAVPRWFRSTPFWQSLEGAHRAVIDQLYHQIASERVVQQTTGIVCERGEWAISHESLAEAAGVSKKQARTALNHAIENGVIRARTIAKRLPNRTLHISLFTWLDFDLYDLRSDAAGIPLGIPLGTPLGIPPGTPPGKEKTLREYTSSEDTKQKTRIEDGAAVAAPPPSPASTKQGKRKLTDEQKQLLCESPENMTAWYAFGWDAVGRPPSEWSAAGPPSRTNWAPRSGDYSQPEPDAPIEAIAAWTWIRLCHARATARLRVTLPAFDKLLGVVRSLSDRMTRQQYIQHVCRVTDRWPEIQAALGNWGRGLTLDETIISVPQVLAQSERLAGGQPVNQIDNTISPLLQKQDFSKRKEGKYAHCYSN